MNFIAPLALTAAGVIALLVLGAMARKRRREAGLGDRFSDAVKDKKYRAIIAGMAAALLISVLSLIWRGYF